MAPKVNPKVNAVARVQVTVEVGVGSWGADCQVEQVLRQAGDDGVARVMSAIRERDPAVRLIDHKVIAVLAERER